MIEFTFLIVLAHVGSFLATLTNLRHTLWSKEQSSAVPFLLRVKYRSLLFIPLNPCTINVGEKTPSSVRFCKSSLSGQWSKAVLMDEI